MKIDSLETLLQEELKDIYDAEKRLVKAIRRWQRLPRRASFAPALEEHLEVTRARCSAWKRYSISSARLPRPSHARV
jgi:ferritin-like metal-binding protein YciE